MTADPLTAVKELKQVAQSPKHRATILHDKASIQSLVLFLDNSDPMVVQETLLTFLHLTSSLEDRQMLRKFLDLVQILRNLHENMHHDQEIRKLAGEVYRRLDLGGGLDLNQTGIIRKGSMRISNLTSESKSPFLKKNGRGRSLVFYIEGLDKENKPVIEDVFFNILGVISFTFDLSKHRTVIRVRPEVSAAVIAQAVCNAGFPSPQQVVKNSKGQEEYLTFDCSRPSSPMPEYLPEEDPEVEDPTTAVRVQGDRTETDTTWFTATVNYLARSMYW